MTFRTCILLACMLVVPGLAMFSHRLPVELRATLRQQVWVPVQGAVHATAKALSLTSDPPPAAASPVVAAATPVLTTTPAAVTPAAAPAPPSAPRPPTPASLSPPARVVMPTVSLAPANAIVDQPAPQGNGLAVPTATSRAAERSFTQPSAPQRAAALAEQASQAAAPPEPAVGGLMSLPQREPPLRHMAPEPPLAGDDAGPSIAAVHQRLAALGAFGVECQPLGNGAAGYASSCRMNVDPNGELHRMFHGTGPDAAAAMQSLVEQVEGWKRQQAAPARL